MSRFDIRLAAYSLRTRLHTRWRTHIRRRDAVRARWREYVPFYKRNLKVAFPVMLTQAGASLVALADSMMVGHYGTADLAAVSFSNAIFFTAMVFAMGALMGITPLIGIQVGHIEATTSEQKEKHKERISSLLLNGITFTVLLSLLMAVLLGGCIPFLDHFGQEKEVVEAARPYYILIVASIVPFLFFCLQKQFLEGLGNTTAALIITTVMNILNVVLNYILIFGHCGFPAMGAAGAGWSTFLSRLLMPFCFMAVIWWKKEWHRYVKAFTWRMASWREVRHLLKVGFPIGVQSFSEAFIFTLSFIIVGWLSKEALAAHQIANQIADFTFMLAMGIGAATTIRVSHQYGKGDLKAMRMAANASIHLVLIMNTIGASLMILFRHHIPLLFSEDEKVIPIASTLLLMAAAFQYADGMQAVGAAMLRGITDVKKPMIYAFVAYTLIGLPIGIICMFPLGMGVTGMWIGFIVGLALAAIAFHIRFRIRFQRLVEQQA
ncbi:MAG: MATE family efflux transporter [Paludibacteraceae bacterium]|nr:MATE family efflux transporter [Paludibacteraceae bacterium]